MCNLSVESGEAELLQQRLDSILTDGAGTGKSTTKPRVDSMLSGVSFDDVIVRRAGGVFKTNGVYEIRSGESLSDESALFSAYFCPFFLYRSLMAGLLLKTVMNPLQNESRMILYLLHRKHTDKSGYKEFRIPAC